MLLVDLRLAREVNGAVPAEVHAFFRWITELGQAYYWILAAALIYLFPNYLMPFLRRGLGLSRPSVIHFRYHLMAGYVFLVLSIGGIVVHLLKVGCGRSRPSLLLDAEEHFFAPFSFLSKTDAFPSGHSQVIWGAMIAFSFLCPRLRVVFITFAAAVSSSRIILGRHYLSDVIAGAAISFVVAVLLKRWMEPRFRYGAVSTPLEGVK